MPPIRRSQEQEAALLKWVNTFPISSPVADISDLSDGLVFSKMLESFDEQYALSDREKHPSGPTQWLNKKTVLESVFKSLIRYIRSHATDLEHLTLNSIIDFNKIAEHDDIQETIKFLAIFLVTAAYCPDRQRYLDDMAKLDEGTQNQLGELIKLMAIEQPKASKDTDLALEEKVGLLKADHEALKKRHADLYTRNEELQIRNEELHTLTEDLQKKNRILEDASHGDQAQYIQVLQIKIEECESLIEAQELKIEDNRIATERQARELAARPSAERIEEINDELRMLKVENASLTKKANTVDHYKRKLESVKVTEDDNKRLRENLDTLQSNQAFFDEAITERDQATNTVAEYRKQFEQYENREVDFEVQIRTLREELRNRDSEVEHLKSKADHDEEFISDLQEQIRNGDRGPLSPDSPAAEASHMTLEEELASPSYDLEISKLKSVNQTLKSSNAHGSVAALRIELEESEKIRKRLEKSLQELTEKHTVGQEQLRALISTSLSEKDEAIANTRKLYLEANQDLASTRRQLVELQADIAGRERELVGAKADLSAISRDELRALAELKEANDIATTSLQNDLKFLQSRHKNLEIDHDQTRSHLIEALLTKDNLTKELSNFQDGPNKTSSESPAEVEKTKTALQALKQQTEEQEALIEELQEKVRLAEEGGIDAQKAANDALIKNLTRENLLITTAWYDLTSRLQSNHVVLQRRQDAPKSWLNKQRQMVNATPRR